MKVTVRLAMMYCCYWMSEWVRHITSGTVLSYVMDLADQEKLNMNSNCGFNGISEFRGSDEALTAK